jgi:hypothetical protein
LKWIGGLRWLRGIGSLSGMAPDMTSLSDIESC